MVWRGLTHDRTFRGPWRVSEGLNDAGIPIACQRGPQPARLADRVEVGDHRTFDEKSEAFQQQGYISLLERDGPFLRLGHFDRVERIAIHAD